MIVGTVIMITAVVIMYIVVGLGIADIYKDIMLYPKDWYNKKRRVMTKAFVAVMIIVGSTWIIWVFPFMLLYCLKLCYLKIREWVKYFMNLPNTD